MSTVTIFGKGNMGTSIAGIFARGGADVQHIDTSSSGAPIEGDLVVLAVPYPAEAAIVDAYGDQLAGKIVVDITNPLNFETFDSLVVPADGSAAAELAGKLPESRVVKAFNTNFAATLATGQVGTVPTTVLVAGDDSTAKNTVLDLVRAGGLQAIDAGALSRARELEAIWFLQLTLAVAETVPWTGGIAIQR